MDYPIATCYLFIVGTPSDKVKDVNVTYSPDPPQKNKNVTIYFSGNLSKICVCMQRE